VHHAVVACDQDAQVGRAEQPLAAVENLLEHRAGVLDRAADHLQDFGGRSLALKRLARVVEQPRVAQRDRGVPRQACEELEVARRERRPAAAPYRHRTLHAVAFAEQRHHHQPVSLAQLGAWHADRTRIGVRVVDELGPAAIQEVAHDALTGTDHRGLQVLGDVALRDDRAVDGHSLLAACGQEDRAGAGVQQLARVTGNSFHDGGEVERRRQVAADLGQRSAFSRAPLRFLEQARVLQGHAHARSDGF
jgi:hypothetical protein